jgi:GTP cyclohydrolase I
MTETDKNEAENLIKRFLVLLGEDVEREDLLETPQRIVRMYRDLFSGYKINPSSILKTFSGNGYHDLVTISNIEFHSLCEHHMIPFYGHVDIGYVPGKKILGLSKFARIVDLFSQRLQTQENLTKQIADFINSELKPQGVIVHIEAEHLCVNMRGVKKGGLITSTTTSRGSLSKKQELVNQFNRDIHKNTKLTK